MSIRKRYISLVVVVMLLVSSPVRADNLAWYRMGDDDGSLVPPPAVGADLIDSTGTLNHPVGTTWSNPLDPVTAFPVYSDQVPGPVIYNPQTDSYYPNLWSMEMEGDEDNERARAGSQDVPEQFSYEVFFRYDDLSSASDMAFVYQIGGTGGGWSLTLQSDAKVRLQMDNPGNSPDYDLIVDSTTALTAGQWHHVGVIFEGNSQDDSNDTHLYIDHQLDVSDNYNDGEDFGVGSNTVYFYHGNRNETGTWAAHLDESRYFDEVLPLDGSGFLTALTLPTASALVDRVTGEITLVNSGSVTLPIRGYSITSASGGLDPAGWKSIADNYDVDSGDHSVDMDDTWTKLTNEVNVTYMDLSEFQFGANPGPGDGGVIDVNDSVVLSEGEGWIPSPYEDLVMTMTLDNGTLLPVSIEYSGELLRSDLNHDGNITASDWDIFRLNNGTKLLGFTLAQKYARGDLDLDGDNDIFDFVLFESDYDAANGAGAFAAMLQAVPEPSSFFLICLGVVAAAFIRRRSVLLSVPLVLVMLMTGSAQAETLAWYRMGDDDGNLTTPPQNGNQWDPVEGTLDNPLGSYNNLDAPNAADSPLYSNVVPGGLIYDPMTDAIYTNQWSLQTTGTSEQVGRTDPQTLPLQFTHEVFFRYDNLADSAGMEVAYHLGATGGGWLIELQPEGHVRLQVHGYDEPDAGLELNSTSVLTPGKWHHVAVTFDFNTTAGSPDTNLYVDYQLEASGNFPDDLNYSISTVRYWAGSNGANGDSGRAGRIDEARYMDTIIAPSDFLRVGATMRALVHPLTGEIALYNATSQAISLYGYQIDSPAGALLDANESWNSLSDQNLDPIGAGPGETWVESGGSGASTLAELFLEGNTTIPAGESLNIGTAYNTSMTDVNMTVAYSDRAYGIGITGKVTFLGDMNDDGLLTEADVPLFIQALTNRAAYESSQKLFALDADVIGDFDGNGLLDFGDVAQFSQAVANATSAAAGASAVPEPSGLILFGLALAAVGCRAGRRRRGCRL